MSSRVYAGLAGTAKSTVLRSEIISTMPVNFLLLTFNRALVQDAHNSNPQVFSKNNTMTIHAMCYKVLYLADSLPHRVKNLNKHSENFDLSSTDLDGDFYKSLLKLFVRLPDQIIRKHLGDLDLIAIDEVEDLSDLLVKVISKLREVYD